jgi:hypothetical protein
MRRIVLTFVFTHTILIFYGQSKCNLYIDELLKGDTLIISTQFFLNKNIISEQILIYKNVYDQYFAEVKTDSLKNIRFELSKSKLKLIENFEIDIRKQLLKRDFPIYIQSLAEYKISFRKGLISYSTREEFYSLSVDLLQ